MGMEGPMFLKLVGIDFKFLKEFNRMINI
jgi:hypothetical protein